MGDGGRRGGHTRRKVCVVGPDENKVGTRGARLPSSAGGTWRAGALTRLVAAGCGREAGRWRGCQGWRDGVAEPGCSRAAARAAGQRGSAPRGNATLRGDGRCAELLVFSRWAAAGSFNTVSLRCFKHSNPETNPKPLTRIGK